MNNYTSPVSGDDQVFNEVFCRDNFDNIIETEGRLLLTKLILKFQIQSNLVSLIDPYGAADIFLGTHGDHFIVIGVLMRDEHCRFVLVSSINAVFTNPIKDIQVKVLNDAVRRNKDEP